MVDQYLPTTAEQAERDLTSYIRYMALPDGWQLCLAIEERWGLDGYTPAVVSVGLNAIANDKDPDAAIDKYFGGDSA